jgi:hypothetical protein
MEQPNETNHSKIIMTDYLSGLTELIKVFPNKNSMENKILNMLAEKENNLKLMWIPAQTGIEGNEAAKDTVNEDIFPVTKATEMDWKRWLKNVARKIIGNKW